ncbi:PhoH family protein, partial [Streptomyces rimosus]
MYRLVDSRGTRPCSLHDAFVIVDEAQSLERNVLLTVLSRIGANS